MAESQPTKGRRRAAKVVESTVIEETAEEKALVTAAKGRATPGRRAQDEHDPAQRGFFGRMIDYVAGVRSELDKVSWPTREQAVLLFRVVLVVTIAAAIVLGIVSFIFNELFAVGLANPIIFVITGAIVGVATFMIMRRRNTIAPSSNVRR